MVETRGWHVLQKSRKMLCCKLSTMIHGFINKFCESDCLSTFANYQSECFVEMIFGLGPDEFKHLGQTKNVTV